MSYDFGAIKLIPIASVLRPYGVEVRKRSDKELVCRCPLPSHKEAEHKNDNLTFCIGVEKNKWYCQSDSCRQIGNHPKGGDVIDLICRLDHCDTKQAAKKLSELFAIKANGTHQPSKPSSEPVAEVRNPPLTFTLKNLDPDHPFLKEKGISIETAMEFGVGYHSGKGSMAGRIVFPLHEDGSLIGHAGRSVDGSEPRWKLPQGLHRTFLYGLERCDATKPLILCESCWAVLHFHQHGVQAVALIGTTLTDAQEKLLTPFSTITVAMDNDEPGRTAARKIAERLKATGKNVRTAFLRE
jgi:DNA primase